MRKFRIRLVEDEEFEDERYDRSKKYYIVGYRHKTDGRMPSYITFQDEDGVVYADNRYQWGFGINTPQYRPNEWEELGREEVVDFIVEEEPDSDGDIRLEIITADGDIIHLWEVISYTIG